MKKINLINWVNKFDNPKCAILESFEEFKDGTVFSIIL